jgi:D-arabinose 1-dehydrogenase-like Zn-dependent alcohol dehydrogenase
MAVFEAKGPFKPHTFAMRPLGPKDVEIAVTHCGICYSDIHAVDG